jgi:hypothetical protein
MRSDNSKALMSVGSWLVCAVIALIAGGYTHWFILNLVGLR